MTSRITLLLLLIVASLRLAAQTGTITGTITANTHLPVASAVISLAQKNMIISTTYSNGQGRYSISNVKPGTYDIKVVATGFTNLVKNGITVTGGSTTKLDIVLQRRNIQPKPVRTGEGEVLHDELKSVQAVSAYSWHKDARKERHIAPSGAGAIYYSPADHLQKPQFYNPSEEIYKKNTENDFMNVKASPLSTMSVDVDRASYSNVRRFLNEGQLPPVDAVRVEEMINYFDYSYPQPTGKDPISINTELVACPWNNDHKLLRIGIQAKKINTDNLPPSNLVFLIDVSGSMESQDRLPLLIAGMKLLVNNLRAKDRVAIVTYAGNAGLVLPSTRGNQKQTILDALDKLHAGGSTAGGAGIKLAYKVARENFIDGGNNRVLLATDGDFNVGVSSDNELETMIVEERKSGVFLTCLGFGTGNYKDAKMEMLADKGNGNYDYIDNIQEAQKTLVSEFGGTLFTIAKDVKAQIEFNPGKVQGYRLVGYENRLLNAEDFKDDKKDAGDMGSGHVVTILYELIPTGIDSKYMRGTNDLKYQQPAATQHHTRELATVKFRYKQPDEHTSQEITHTIADNTIRTTDASDNTRFAASVAMLGMLLTDSQYKGTATYTDLIAMAEQSKSYDKEGYKAEFIRLAKAANALDKRTASK